MQLPSWKNFLISPITKSAIVDIYEMRYGGRGEGREGRTDAHPPSRNPGYAYEMRSTYDKITYAYTMYNTLSEKITHIYVRSHLVAQAYSARYCYSNSVGLSVCLSDTRSYRVTEDLSDLRACVAA